MAKKIIATFLSLIMLLALAVIPSNAYDGYIGWLGSVGDINDDWEINPNDYAMLKAYVLCQGDDELQSHIEFSSADVNLDGSIDGFDAIELQVFIDENGDYYF